MISGSSIIIAKRSLTLSKTYVLIGLVISLFGIAFPSVGKTVGSLATQTVPSNSGVDIGSVFPLISIPMLVFAAISFTTPVLLLYVYDKNNGVLEYFLSIGMDQADVYRSYLKAALLLGGALLVFDVVANIVVGLIVKVDVALLAEVSILTPVIALPVISFITIIMMAFSSLQKQRVGSNQPLGIAIGVFLVMPSYIIPLVVPSIALPVDLAVAAIIVGLSLAMYFLASKLIRREKLLP